MRQDAFTKALLDPTLAVPEGLVDAQGRPAGRRFSVYRNNVANSLTEGLEQGFPVIRKLVGDEYFKALAGNFLRAHPPTSKLMMFYGAEMPAFLADFPPLAHLPYLADVARLELALRESYHATDATPIEVEVLSNLAPEAFISARFKLAPALRVVVSRYPVWSIWQANSVVGVPAPVMRPEAAIVIRPGYDPVAHLLPEGGAAFVGALQAGQSIGAAVDLAGEGFDLSAILGLLIGGGALIELNEET